MSLAAGQFFHNDPSPLQAVQLPLLQHKGVELFIKRDDLLHPQVSGNKWRKLKYNLLHAQQTGARRLLSFGGAYSNHIHALAHAGRLLDFDTIGVIRGGPFADPSPTLREVQACGMRLYHVSRQQYRLRHAEDFQHQLRRRFGDFLSLPEGGSNSLALRGCAELVAELDAQLDEYDVVCVPCGTGGTLAGIAAALLPGRRAVGVAVLKGAAFLRGEVRRLLAQAGADGEFSLWLDYHGGGYARCDETLLRFMEDWRRDTGIELDAVYTGKMMRGLLAAIERDYFPPGSRIVAVHTGGLQGNAGMSRRLKEKRA